MCQNYFLIFRFAKRRTMYALSPDTINTYSHTTGIKKYKQRQKNPTTNVHFSVPRPYLGRPRGGAKLHICRADPLSFLVRCNRDYYRKTSTSSTRSECASRWTRLTLSTLTLLQSHRAAARNEGPRTYSLVASAGLF